MAIARLPNQGDFEISDDLVKLAEDTAAARAQRDSLVRHALSFAPSVLNATLSYKEEGGRTVVTVTPQLGRKAQTESMFADLHQHLRTAPPYLDPAVALSLEIHWRNLVGVLHPVDLLLSYRPRLEEMVVGHERELYRREFGETCERLREIEGCLPSGQPAGL